MEMMRDKVHLSFEMVGSQDTTASGEKPPIICLHGVMLAKESWKNVIRPIAAATGRKVYAYDARNHGDSGWSDHFDYDIMQEDLLQFMECIHSQKAILLGHSMGGKTAMFFATNQPERVEKLIVEDISPKPSAPRLQAQKYVHLLKEVIQKIPAHVTDLQEAKNFVCEFLRRNTSEDPHNSAPERNDGTALPLCQDETGKFKWKTNLTAIEDSFLTVTSKSMVNGSFSVPTLILYGTKSPYTVSADRDFIQKIFSRVQFRAVEGAAHQIHEEFGDLFVKEVVDFINET